MTLTDPQDALADHSSFIDYLVGLAGLARTVRALATDDNQLAEPAHDPDDFVHVLLGIASLGESIERLGESVAAQQQPRDQTSASAPRWLR